ncbi:Retrovirus-related Pol polyprotein from transposon 17.6, partial [Mucuna pruriens]
MEVFMDDFMVYTDSFDACLENLSKVLTRCININLVLKFEKCHFMVIEGIVLGHLVSNKGILVDKSKIDIITSLPNPTYVREVCLFLGHAGLYRRFIKNFNKIALLFIPGAEEPNHIRTYPPSTQLGLSIRADVRHLQFGIGAVLGQRARAGKRVHLNYTTIEKELLTIVFALDKFCSYVLGSKIIVFSDHAALRFLLKKLDVKPRLIRWMLLLPKFNIEIKDKKGAKNSVPDHLSRIERENEFLDEQLLHINTPTPWFADICIFVAASQFPLEASQLYKEKLIGDAKYYIWDDPYLWSLCNDQVIRKCILDTKIKSVLQFCHAAPGGSHYRSTRIARKVLD